MGKSPVLSHSLGICSTLRHREKLEVDTQSMAHQLQLFQRSEAQHSLRGVGCVQECSSVQAVRRPCLHQKPNSTLGRGAHLACSHTNASLDPATSQAAMLAIKLMVALGLCLMPPTAGSRWGIHHSASICILVLQAQVLTTNHPSPHPH